MAEIIIRNLRKEFGDFIAVESSSFTVGDEPRVRTGRVEWG